MKFRIQLPTAKMVRDNTLHGALWFFPVAAVIWGFRLAMDIADGGLGSLVATIWHAFRPDAPVPGHGRLFSLLLLFVFFFLVGTFLRWSLGNRIAAFFERFMQRVRVAGKIFGSLKKMVNIIGDQDHMTKAFQRVVRVPYLNGPGTCVCFMTNSRVNLSGKLMVTVFIPTPPNPTGGLLAEYPAEVVEDTGWTLDQGLEYCFSFGLVSPDNSDAEVDAAQTFAKPTTITIEGRSGDYMAYLNGDTRLWSSGKSEAEAIGAVLLSHVLIEQEGGNRQATTLDLSRIVINRQ